MNTPESGKTLDPPKNNGPIAWPVVTKELIIWGLFFALLYLARDFFFLGFMTFLFSYLVLTVVGWIMKRVSPGRERTWLRRMLTIGVFLLVPIALAAIGSLIGPQVVSQGHRLAGWMSQASLETEVSRLFQDFVGPYEFNHKYHGPTDPNYQKDLQAFRESGVRHVTAYNDFPALESWVERGFSDQFAENERARIEHRLATEGTSSAEFGNWLVAKKLPEVRDQARTPASEKEHVLTPVDSYIRAAAADKPEQFLEKIRRDPAALAMLKQEWIDDAADQGVNQAKQSPAYHEQLRAHYEQERERRPDLVPYPFDQYRELQQVRPKGRRAFGEAMEKMTPKTDEDPKARLTADFKAFKEQELFQEWWTTNGFAKFVRNQLDTGASGVLGSKIRRIVTALINIPVDLATALLLSFFICIDFPKLQSTVPRLRETWLRDVYDEIVPALSSLGKLIGRSLHAQGIIALCNATVLFIAFKILGVEHEVFLSAAVFVLCLVPTLGAMLAWVLIVGFTLFQPGGGPMLALKASVAVVIVLILESLVLSPRILGRMMETHPVLIIAILPLAQYFFGVWGLILATPVAVYVIYVVILQRGLPGIDAPQTVEK